jgi:hypothetical protein
MDRTLSGVLAILVVVLVIFLAAVSIVLYAEITYRATLSGTYDYRVSITSDTTLENVTLYLPIPARGPESSAVLEAIGAGRLRGLPGGWNTSLIGTEKFTLLEVTAPEMAASPVGRPYLLTVSVHTTGPIDTRNAGTGDLVLVPSAMKVPAVCSNVNAQVSTDTRCELYRGSTYADFTSPGNVHLSVFIFLTGRNTWDVFGPSSNEYQDGLQVTFSGGDRGWQTGDGILVTGLGDYGLDLWLLRPGTPEAVTKSTSQSPGSIPVAVEGQG